MQKDVYPKSASQATGMAIPAAPYQSPVTGSIEALCVAIEALDGQVRDLVSRLEPVLGQSNPRTCASEVEAIAECKICDAIDSRMRQVRGISAVVADTLDRLKL